MEPERLDAPPEVWAEIDAAIDEYVAEWGKALREAITSPEHEKFEAEWDEEKHPRHPAGSSEGGEFAPAGGGGAAGGDQINALRSLLPKGTSDDGVRTPGFTFQSYHSELREIERDPAKLAHLNSLVERYGTKNVALALVDGRLHMAAGNLDGQLRSATFGQHELFEQPPPVGAPIPESARLAFAIEHKLSPEEFVRMSLAAQIYSESGYRAVNAPLRIAAAYGEPGLGAAAKGAGGPQAEALREGFDRLLSAAPDIKGDDTIYRASRLPRMSGLAEKLLSTKGEYVEPGFISASSSKSFCEGWIRTKILDDDGDPGKSYFLFDWRNAGGAKNVTPFLAAKSKEGEINYRPGAKIKILGHTSLGGFGSSRVYRVHLEVGP